MSEQSDVTVGQMIQYEIEKESRIRGVTFEYVERSNERLRVEIIDGVPHVVGNAEGLLALAKLLAKVGAGHKCAGLKLHLRENLDGDRAEVLRIMVEDGQPAKEPAPEEGITATQ